MFLINIKLVNHVVYAVYFNSVVNIIKFNLQIILFYVYLLRVVKFIQCMHISFILESCSLLYFTHWLLN